MTEIPFKEAKGPLKICQVDWSSIWLAVLGPGGQATISTMRVILLQLKENADESLQRAWKNGAAEVLQSALARMGCTCAIEVNEGKDGRWMAEVNSQTTGTILETHFNLGQVDEDGEEKQLEVNAKASAQDPSGAVDAGNGSRDVSMPPVEGDSKQLVHMFYVRLHVPKYMEARDGARKVLNPHV